ncbi:MAG TPA: hypothetical protein VGD43_00050 [Micromonospora sp.]
MTPSATPSPTPTASPTPTTTPTRTPSSRATSEPAPTAVLLGPAGSGELSAMVERYCDRHVSRSSTAEPRRDGGWECERFLASPRLVDMGVACADTDGAGAYARNVDGGAYGWRCYR